MPTFVKMTRCDGCGHCVDICPSDIMHIIRLPCLQYRAQRIGNDSCVRLALKMQSMCGGTNFVLGHSVRVLREGKRYNIVAN